jgi:cytidylate kinase
MRIITISREFGSGGRELGKRMADELGFAYFDREIITAIAQKRGLDENYVEHALDNSVATTFSFTFRHSFAMPPSFS